MALQKPAQKKSWLKQHTFTLQLVAFLLMIVPPIPMSIVAHNQAIPLIWALIGVVVLGNVLILVVGG